MAHHQDKVGNAVADRVGLFTAALSMAGIVLAVALIIRQPKIAFPCIGAAAIFTGICPSPTQNPLLGLAAIVVGMCLVKGD